ncbi:MAG TPA: hypothetical protein VK971_07915 [Thiohalobacter sp.]|nr:hypothetical protein [Thiohalobacter sp.]
MIEPDSDAAAGTESRRRILKGAALTPVLLSLASRPVLGQECTISGMMSGNTSNHGAGHDCGGLSPGAWKTADAGAGDWSRTPCKPGTLKASSEKNTFSLASRNGRDKGKSPYDKDGTLFFAYPDSFRGRDPHYAGKTLMEVLWMNGKDDPHKFGAHIVAALLNAYAIPDYGMTPTDVQELYENVERHGGPTGSGYVSDTGKMLSVRQVVYFIQQTFG